MEGTCTLGSWGLNKEKYNTARTMMRVTKRIVQQIQATCFCCFFLWAWPFCPFPISVSFSFSQIYRGEDEKVEAAREAKKLEEVESLLGGMTELARERKLRRGENRKTC